MRYIKNYDALASNEHRKVVLELIEAAFASIAPEEVFSKDFSLNGNSLTIQGQTFDLGNFDRLFLLGFGKGSALMCKILEEKLGDKITEGFDIDVVDQTFNKVQFTKGTHPLPSQENFDFTKTITEKLSGLTERDLVLITTCGGGSVMFETPHTLDLEHMRGVNKALLNCGATISEMNAVRKHLSKVKGGGLAKILYPATVINLLFSDVPGNDLSVIASGPLVKDASNIEEATAIYEKYTLKESGVFSPSDFVETPKEDKYFEKVHNILLLSNHTALTAMEKKAREFGLQAVVSTDRLQGDSHKLGEQLLREAKPGEILLAGGESTIKITGTGKGGRNQALVLSALPFLEGDTVLASFDSDGWDFYQLAGALADKDTLKKIEEKHVDTQAFLRNDDSYGFFEQVGDGIATGKLESNVSDLFIVYKPTQVVTVEPFKQDAVEESAERSPKESGVTPNPPEKPAVPAEDSRQYALTGELYESKLVELEKKANEARQLVIETLLEAGSGHSAGSLGMADIFTAFYFHILNHDPKNPEWEDRDRLVLSNGHICPIRYVSMAQAGYFPVDELKTLRKINSRLQGHPHRTVLPGLETTSGPLGEGISQAIGIALAAKLDKKNYQVYVIAGDGELEEGNIWEALMYAGKKKLNNITLVIDRNNIQIDGFTEDVMPLEPLKAKLEAFNWEVFEADGHNIRTFVDTVRECRAVYEKPTAIIAHTIPGMGVDFMEKDFHWHGVAPDKEQAKKALTELRTLQGKIASEHEA